MGFLYPFFLLAGLAVAVPVAIHLFDLRRFRRVVFPATRFLKESLLRSRRQNRLREKLLLALRCLFVAVLVAAFAQPFLQGDSSKKGRNIQVVVVDNNPATEARRAGRMAIERSKELARDILRSGSEKTYLLLSNGPYSYAPLNRETAVAAVSEIRPTAGSKKNTELLAAIQGMMTDEGAESADVWWISAFPKAQFELRPEASLLKGIRLHGVVAAPENTANIWIDTAFVLPAANPTAESKLVVKSRTTAQDPPADVALRLTSNAQFQSAATEGKWNSSVRVDTLAFGGQSTLWQKLQLTIADGSGPAFDDTFRIAVRPEKPLPVLLLEEGAASPYLRTALDASGRFVVTTQSLNSTIAAPEKYALLILSGLRGLPSQTVASLRPALQRGIPVIIFPTRTDDFKTLETGLRQLTDIRISGIDTALQTASSLQSENPLITEIFEATPPNMELPAAGWHYRVAAGFGAQSQSVISFRNGDPLLAQYATGSGDLYLLTTSIDASAGSFGRSYFFAPMLHVVAVAATGAAAVAYTAGSGRSIFIPRAREAGGREVVKMQGEGLEAVPLQKQSMGGIDIFPDGAVSKAGFYTLSGASSDTVLLALNASRKESLADNWTAAQLREGWAGKGAEWVKPEDIAAGKTASPDGGTPLWKIGLILALLLLATETAVLLRRRTVAAQSLSPQP